MPSTVGKQAIVVGSGIGGLTTARVLADHFDHVMVLERDSLSEQADARAGIPQGKHAHALLAGGQQVLNTLFPRFEQDLAQTGAVPLVVGLDLYTERPGFDPFPQRDLGFCVYAQSRPQLELCVRRRVMTHDCIDLRPQCNVRELLSPDQGATVTGLTYLDLNGATQYFEADLIVDASGRGALTLDFLKAHGYMSPDQTTIGVDFGYASAVFERPADAPSQWKGIMTFPKAPKSSRAALLLPMEHNRWLLSAGGRFGEYPPDDPDGFMDYLQHLRTPTIYNAVRNARRLGEIARFRFPESRCRHYEQLSSFPRGLLPLGDAICRFNPVYGQGMSVAAQEAQALGQLLSVQETAPNPLDGLAPPFFAKAAEIIETPWAMAALPDLIYPETRGERPANFKRMLQRGAAMTTLAAQDPAVHKLTSEVANLLKPRRVLQEPALQQRVQAILAKQTTD